MRRGAGRSDHTARPPGTGCSVSSLDSSVLSLLASASSASSASWSARAGSKTSVRRMAKSSSASWALRRWPVHSSKAATCVSIHAMMHACVSACTCALLCPHGPYKHMHACMHACMRTLRIHSTLTAIEPVPLRQSVPCRPCNERQRRSGGAACTSATLPSTAAAFRSAAAAHDPQRARVAYTRRSGRKSSCRGPRPRTSRCRTG